MKISIHKGYILIISDRFVTLLSKVVRLPRSMGFSLFPCIIVFRNLTHPMTEQWIMHERIHIYQSFESIFLIFPFAMLEYLYARIILKYSHTEAYFYECVEQEAYLNQYDQHYLENRRFFSIWKYIKQKTKLHTDGNYHVVIEK